MTTYVQGASLPDLGLELLTADGATIDFSSGWTFSIDIVRATEYTVTATKTTGITGASTSPNLTIQWGVSDLDIEQGEYILYISATHTATSKKRIYQQSLTIAEGAPSA